MPRVQDRRVGTPELQASLQALPPDSPSSQTSEPARKPPGVGNTGQAHWNINNGREKPALPRRAAKAVSLKLAAKGAPAPTGTAPPPALGNCIGVAPIRRACSADVPYMEPSAEAALRQLPRSAESQKRSGNGRAHGSPTEDPFGGGSMADLLGEKLASTVPSVVRREAGSYPNARPPVPTRSLSNPTGTANPSPAAVAATASPEALSRRFSNEDESPAADLQEDHKALEQVYDPGRVFGPAVASPVRVLPRGRGGRGGLGGRGAGFRGGMTGQSRGRGASAATPSQPSAPAPMGGLADLLGGAVSRPSTGKSRPGTAASRPGTAMSEALVEELPPSAPRIAWSDGEQDLEDGVLDSSVTEMAAQIRRERLIRSILDLPEPRDDAEGPSAEATERSPEDGPEDAGRVPSSPSRGKPWVPQTEEARSALSGMDKTLEEAFAKGEAQRQELGGFLEQLRRRTFEDPDDVDSTSVGRASAGHASEGGGSQSSKKRMEMLVSIPADFDDLVDLNAQESVRRRELAAQRKRAAAIQAKAPVSRAGVVAPKVTAAARVDTGLGGARGHSDAKENVAESNTEVTDTLKLPSFLQKYFSEEKALEQLPHKRLELEDKEAEKIRMPDEETDLQRMLRQITRLDGLLLKQEAEGTAKIQAAQVELESARNSLAKEADRINSEKMNILQKIKERAMNGGASSVSSKRSGKTQSTSITPSATPGVSTSCSSRSLVTPDSGSRCSVLATPVEEESAGVVWDGWSSTDVGVAPPAATTPTSARAQPATNATDEDTSTFDLTSGGALGSREKKPTPFQEFMSKKQAGAGLATVDECETQDAVPGVEESEKLALEEHGAAVPDDPYAEDSEAIDALRAIDERLQKLVPEQEWEAKSICSFPSHHLGSVAGDSHAESSRPARSVWSIASRNGAVAPGDPVLCEQFEKRETELALVSIDNRLREIECGEMPAVPEPDQLKQLLLQAAQETAAPDAQNRVLALTGTGPLNLSAEEKTNLSSTALATSEPAAAYRDSEVLRKARQILGRLENEDGEWVDAFGEAQNSLALLEDDLQHMQKLEAESRPGSSMPSGVPRSEEEAAAEPEALPAPPASELEAKLEDLRSQVAAVLEKEGPDEDFMTRLRRHVEEQQMEISLPALGAAGAESSLPEPSEGDDLDSDLGAFDNAIDYEASHQAFDPPELAVDGPNAELMKALNLDLPTGDDQWDDETLLRCVGAINSHYGDVAPEPAEVEVPPLQPAASDSESDAL